MGGKTFAISIVEPWSFAFLETSDLGTSWIGGKRTGRFYTRSQLTHLSVRVGWWEDFWVTPTQDPLLAVAEKFFEFWPGDWKRTGQIRNDFHSRLLGNSDFLRRLRKPTFPQCVSSNVSRMIGLSMLPSCQRWETRGSHISNFSAPKRVVELDVNCFFGSKSLDSSLLMDSNSNSC